MLGSIFFLINHDIEAYFVMVLLEGLYTTARPKGIGKILDSVSSNTKEHTVVFAPWFREFPHCGTVGGYPGN